MLPCSTKELRQFALMFLIYKSEINAKKRKKENETKQSNGARVPSWTQEIRLICKMHTESFGHVVGM